MSSSSPHHNLFYPLQHIGSVTVLLPVLLLPQGSRDVLQFYEDSCLVRQKFVMADDQSVQVLSALCFVVA